MARPRRGKSRRNSVDWIADFLITGLPPDKSDTGVNRFEVIQHVHSDSPLLQAAWQESGIMRDWILPGIRPFGWWLYDAPRLPVGTFTGWYYDGLLPEPRRHLGGPGKPLHEVLNFTPHSRFGIWDWYGDPDNPPIFETQFDYLARLGLLLPGEDVPVPEQHPHPARIEDADRWEANRNRRNQP